MRVLEGQSLDANLVVRVHRPACGVRRGLDHGELAVDAYHLAARDADRVHGQRPSPDQRVQAAFELVEVSTRVLVDEPD